MSEGKKREGAKLICPGTSSCLIHPSAWKGPSRRFAPKLLWPEHHDSSPIKWERGDDAALPVDPLEETESASKEGGDEEVSKPALVVVRRKAARADLQDIQLRYAEDPQRPSCLTNRCPELRLARQTVRAGACAGEALVVDASP
jgi:hypothetical protein